MPIMIGSKVLAAAYVGSKQLAIGYAGSALVSGAPAGFSYLALNLNRLALNGARLMLETP